MTRISLFLLWAQAFLSLHMVSALAFPQPSRTVGPVVHTPMVKNPRAPTLNPWDPGFPLNIIVGGTCINPVNPGGGEIPVGPPLPPGHLPPPPPPPRPCGPFDCPIRLFDGSFIPPCRGLTIPVCPLTMSTSYDSYTQMSTSSGGGSSSSSMSCPSSSPTGSVMKRHLSTRRAVAPPRETLAMQRYAGAML